MKSLSFQKWLLLVVAFAVYSTTGVFSKLASMNDFLSVRYILFFGCVILMLGIYAILWQKILSFMPLHKAYLCKSVCIIVTLVVSHFMFSEVITLYNMLGAAIIISGLVVLAWEK